MVLTNHDETIGAIICSGVFQIITICLNQINEGRKASRERDRKAFEVATKLEQDRIKLAGEVALRIAEAKVENERHSREIKQKIEENTEISRGAFDAANHVNDKIVNIQEATYAILKKQVIDDSQQDRIEDTTVDTQRRVKRVEDAVTNKEDEA